VIGRRDNFDYYTLKLTAKWEPDYVDVRYIVGDKEEVIKYAVRAGYKLILPKAPELGDMVFDCWMDSKGGSHAAKEEFFFDDDKRDLVNGNNELVFTAMFLGSGEVGPELSSLIFDTAGGSYVAPISGAAGAGITPPEDPVRAGFRFDGWTSDKYDGLPDTLPDGMTVMTAKWVALGNVISFETNGGSAVADIVADAGTDISSKKPEEPKRDHYTFAGWMPEYPDVMPETDLILYALWTPSEYTLTYDANGGKFPGGEDKIVQMGIYDSLVFVAGDPSRKGYTFNGWDSDTYSHMPGEDKTIKALWIKNDREDPEYAKTHIVKAQDGSWLGKGASIKAVDYKLTRWKSNSSPKGTKKSPLKLKAKKKTRKSVKLKWNKVNATKKYVIYGGKKGQKLKKIATTSKRTYNVKKIGKKKLKKNTQYRFIVVALDEYNFVNSSSKLVKAKTKKK
jgi:hypothetical protein